MVLGGWLKGILTRIGFVSCRGFLEGLLGREVARSQLTDMDIRRGAIELASLEIGEGGTLGALFERSPFALHSGYIDKLRICLRPGDGRMPYLLLQGVEVTLVLRPGGSRAAGGAEAAAGRPEAGDGTPDPAVSDGEPDHDEDDDGWGIGEKASSLDVLLQTTAVEVSDLTVHFLFEVGAERRPVEILLHVPNARMYDNSFGETPDERPAAYQKVVEIPSAVLQLFQGEDIARDATDKLQDHAQCLVVVGSSQPCTVVVKFPLSAASQEPTLLEVSVPAVEAILTPQKLLLARQCLDLLLTPTALDASTASAAFTAPAPPAYASFGADIGHLHITLLYETPEDLAEVWARSLSRVMGQGTSKLKAPDIGCQLCPEASEWVTAALGSHLRLVVSQLEVQQVTGSPGAPGRAVADALDVTRLAVGCTLEVAEHLSPGRGSQPGAPVLRRLLYCAEDQLSDHHQFSLRCDVTPEREGVGGEWEAKQDCAVAVAPIVVQLDADVVDRVARFLGQAMAPGDAVPCATPMGDASGRAVVVRRTTTTHVALNGVSVLVGLAPSRADDALVACPSLRTFCAERAVSATEALRLGAYAAGLVARSSAVTLTTLEGAPYPPPPEAETRWDWTAQTATVCLQTVAGAYRLLHAADGAVQGHVITRCGPSRLGPEHRQPFTSRQPLETVAQRQAAVRGQAGTALRVVIPRLVGQALRSHFQWARLLLGQFHGADSEGPPKPEDGRGSAVLALDVEVGALDLDLDVAAPLLPLDGPLPGLRPAPSVLPTVGISLRGPPPTAVVLHGAAGLPDSFAALEGSELFYSACSHDDSFLVSNRSIVVFPDEAAAPQDLPATAHSDDRPAFRDRLELRAAHLFLASPADGRPVQVAIHAEDYSIAEGDLPLPILRCVRPGPGGFRLYVNGADGLDVLFVRPAFNYRVAPSEGWTSRVVGFFAGEAGPEECPPPSRGPAGDPSGSPRATGPAAPARRPFTVAIAGQDALLVYEPLHAPAQAALLLAHAAFTTTVAPACPKSRFSVTLGHAALLLHDAFRADVVAYGRGLGHATRGVQAALAELGFVQVLSLSGLAVDVETDAQQRRSISIGDAVVTVDVCADSFVLLKALLQHLASGSDLDLLRGAAAATPTPGTPGVPPANAADVDEAAVTALALAIVTDNPAFSGKPQLYAKTESFSRGRSAPSPQPEPSSPLPNVGIRGGWASAPPKVIDCYVPSIDAALQRPARAPDVVVEVLGTTPPLSPSVEVQTLEGISFSASSSAAEGAKPDVMDIVIDAGDDFIFAYLDAEVGKDSPEWRATLHGPIRLIEDYLSMGPSADAPASSRSPTPSPAAPRLNATTGAAAAAVQTRWRVENVALTLKCFGGRDFSRSGPALPTPAPFPEHPRHINPVTPMRSARGGPDSPLPCSARDSQQAVQFSSRGIELSVSMFDDKSPMACRVYFVAEEVECCDCFVQSTRHVMLGRWSDGGDMLTLLWDVVCPDVQHPERVEHRVRVSLLPLLMNVEQDTAEFLVAFFAGPDLGPDFAAAAAPGRQPDEEAASDSPPYIQHFAISAVDVTLSYEPKRMNFSALRGGNYCEMLNFCSLEGSRISLPAAEVVGCRGLQQVADRLLDVWLPAISRTDYLMFLCGLQPIRALSKVGDSMAGLVLTPLAFYQRDGTLFRGIALALQDFATTICLEAVDLTADVSVGTQSLLEMTASTFSSVGDGRACSKYARQPASPSEGVSQAYSALARSLKAAAQAVVTIPELGPRSGYVTAGLRAVPIVLLNPMIGVTEAVARMLFGVRNALDPHHKVAMDRLYKPG